MTKIQPIILGTDANAYCVACSLHEAYGIRSIAIGKKALADTENSSIVDVKVCPNLMDENIFVGELLRLADTFPKEVPLVLFPCGDGYAKLVAMFQKELKERYLLNSIDIDLYEQLEDKHNFYDICEKYGFDYPATVYVNDETLPEHLPFTYPVAVKATDSIKYVEIDFPGKRKSYKAESETELRSILHDIYSNGYDGEMIIQDFIPGDDTKMFVVNSYSDTKGKVRAMCAAQCLSADPLPLMIGNYNVLMSVENETLYKQCQKFLEEIGYVGLSNFDFKYDERDGKYKVFEINMRQGRSSYYTTISGCNLMKYVVEDLVENKENETFYNKEVSLMLRIPKRLLFSVLSKEMQDKVKSIPKEKVMDQMSYKADFSIKRELAILKRKCKSYYYYRKYFKPE